MTKFKKQFFKLNYKAFPFLFILTYLFLLIESISYIGFISKFVILDSRYFFVLSLLSFLFYRLYSVENRVQVSRFSVLLLRLNKFAFLLATIFYLILQMLEEQHFNNYIFSTYHIQPNNFLNVTLFALAIILIERLSTNNVEKLKTISVFETNSIAGPNRNIGFLITLCIGVLFGVYLLKNISKTFGLVVQSNLFMLNHLSYSYADKMRNVWGFYYDYMVFVKENTPENARILIPPQKGPWFSEGNGALSRYFLYPRKLVNGNDISISLSGYDYIMIAWGSWNTNPPSDYGWPKDRIEAYKLIYFGPKDKTVKVYFENYNPKDSKNSGGWGLIKLNND